MSKSAKIQEKPVNAKQPWSERDEAQAVRAFRDGRKMMDIAMELGRFKYEVVNRLRKFFTDLKKSNNFSNQEILDKTGFDLSHKKKVAKKPAAAQKPASKKATPKKATSKKPNVSGLRALQNQVNSLVAQAALISASIKRMEQTQTQAPKPSPKKPRGKKSQ
jgi:hypothetical protein